MKTIDPHMHTAEHILNQTVVRFLGCERCFSAHIEKKKSKCHYRVGHAPHPDQIRAIAQTKVDLEQPKPMDRLICGDVGYGKTEIALRAAARAVENAKQVALLVPTTILCYQHYASFRRRLAAFPIRIEMLSRLASPARRRSVLGGLADGRVDIVIGTHKLLQRGIAFDNLGLIIVDEEHRFGVRHKEKLKSLRAQVDILTLTATPIPRTLNMSLAGVRDLSIIETPPPGRMAIQTYMIPFRKNVLAQAIRQELRRGGQVFVVHNKIETLPALTRAMQ